MKLSVIGAGAIGSAVAQDLVERDEVTEVPVCDSQPRALRELHERITSPKLRSFQVDARDSRSIESIIRNSSCVVSCVTPELNPRLAALSVELGIHFCDLGGSDEVVHEELALANSARRKSVWVVPNCGLAPGLVNILCVHGIEQFDTVESAHLRVGDIPLEPKDPFRFHIAFSAEKLIEDYTEPAPIIRNGQVEYLRPLTGVEDIDFADSFGRLEAFHASGALSTLPHDLAGKVTSLDCKTIRYPGHAAHMEFLFALGFAEKRSLDVRSHLTYRDVLVRRLQQRIAHNQPDAVLLRVCITGMTNGESRTLVYTMIDRYDADRNLTAMKRCTAFPAAAIAGLIANGDVTGGGAAPPEQIIPKELFFQNIRQRGLDIATKWED